MKMMIRMMMKMKRGRLKHLKIMMIVQIWALMIDKAKQFKDSVFSIF